MIRNMEAHIQNLASNHETTVFHHRYLIAQNGTTEFKIGKHGNLMALKRQLQDQRQTKQFLNDFMVMKMDSKIYSKMIKIFDL